MVLVLALGLTFCVTLNGCLTSLCLSFPPYLQIRLLDSDIKAHLAIKACDPLPTLTKENHSFVKLQLSLSPFIPQLSFIKSSLQA